MTQYARVLSDAGGTGRGIGAALIIALWIAANGNVGGGYAIYRLACHSAMQRFINPGQANPHAGTLTQYQAIKTAMRACKGLDRAQLRQARQGSP